MAAGVALAIVVAGLVIAPAAIRIAANFPRRVFVIAVVTALGLLIIGGGLALYDGTGTKEPHCLEVRSVTAYPATPGLTAVEVPRDTQPCTSRDK